MSTQLIPTDLTARAQVIDGLHQIADYLDQHPEIPVNQYGWDLNNFPQHDADEDDRRAEVDRVAAVLGVQVHDQLADVGHYTATRTFGPISYQFVHITDHRRAVHHAWSSYADAVTPNGPVASDTLVASPPPEAA
ncbi:MAG TPA: hypothetical protein VGS19_11315 [Streptosporangiaceae bacterium]|nr:hypothetical protein [Streptosporangiaceae bacterium]